jgi:hypothetical protein
MAIDPNLGMAVNGLLGKRRRAAGSTMGSPTPGVGEAGSPLAGPPATAMTPPVPPMWTPPPGAMGNVAPPVGSTAAVNQAASAAQNPKPTKPAVPNPVGRALDPQRPETRETAAQIQARNRRLREENAARRAATRGGR